MNLYQLDTETLDKIRQDRSDIEIRREESPYFLTAYNSAYERIIREKIKLWTTEAVTLDADKRFNVSDLTNDCNEIIKITKYQDFSDSAGNARTSEFDFYDYDGVGEIVVPAADDSGTMYVAYRYMPVRLTHKESLFNISGAQTTKTIPIDEAITADMVDALVGSEISVYDASAGTYQTLTIASVAVGAAGAATITVSEDITGTLADGDIIYTMYTTEYRVASAYNTPQFDQAYHEALCNWAAHRYFLRRGANYGDYALMWKQEFEMAFARIRHDYGAVQEFRNLYSPQI